MSLAGQIVVGLVALIQFYAFILETFLWEKRGPKAFKLPPSFFKTTKMIAVNQGVYNLFLSVGLVWSLLINDTFWQHQVALMFLGFVAVAGIVGAITVNKRIFFMQGLPALLGMVLV